MPDTRELGAAVSASWGGRAGPRQAPMSARSPAAWISLSLCSSARNRWLVSPLPRPNDADLTL